MTTSNEADTTNGVCRDVTRTKWGEGRKRGPALKIVLRFPGRRPASPCPDILSSAYFRQHANCQIFVTEVQCATCHS
jgi:hypothetical protein